MCNSCELDEEAAEDYKLDCDHYNIIPVNNENNRFYFGEHELYNNFHSQESYHIWFLLNLTKTLGLQFAVSKQ